MAFRPGHVKMGGRTKGVPNRATAEMREFARSLLEDPAYQKALRKRLIKGQAGAMEVQLLYYAYGKPKSEETATAIPSYLALLENLIAREPRVDPRDRSQLPLGQMGETAGG
jgi:hypothetical protein